MYNLKLVEVVDGFCITCLIPLAVFTLFFNILALAAVIRLRSDHHVSVLGHLVFCDILLVICQAYSLKALVTGRAVSMEVEILCNVCGVIFNMTVAVTWWCLTLAHLVKMWHVTITRRGYYLATAAIWGFAGILAVLPLITSRDYHMSWTHAMCISSDAVLFSVPKHTLQYNVLFSFLFCIQYILPIALCITSIIKGIYSHKKRIRVGWSCTFFIFVTYCLLYTMWWVDEISRHFTRTTYPISTTVIVRRAATFMLLYTKPLISLLCMYHLLPEFRSAFLRIIRLEYKLEAPAGLSGHQYERMYTEIDENLSPAATL
ncbi:hypothetical protein ACHWQZ_G006615 [Mnemiopsis leidyi]